MTLPMLCFELPEAVIVTGASSGLGCNLSRLLAETGTVTIGVDVAGPCEEVANVSGYVHVVGDVSEETTWQQLLAMPEVHGAGSLGLVTAAAVLDVGDITDTERSLIEKTMTVNLVGTALAMKHLIPAMIERGGGPIVAVASVDATFAEQQLAVYAASKGAVRQLARTVAMDHARAGIRVNVLSPGPMMAGLFTRHMSSASDPDRFLATRANRQPGGQILAPEEVARAAMFLLSSGSTAIIGADVIADGGLTTSFDFRTGSEGASV
ncbi:MAG: SDR family oxidoreductase [Hyphomicrobiales bacterium]|nr:SDR family oxidoreductase [Hyphomicrobiales bacterium]